MQLRIENRKKISGGEPKKKESYKDSDRKICDVTYVF